MVSASCACTVIACVCVRLFKQKTVYEMRISDWSSDVCSSDLLRVELVQPVIVADVDPFACLGLFADNADLIAPALTLALDLPGDRQRGQDQRLAVGFLGALARPLKLASRLAKAGIQK